MGKLLQRIEEYCESGMTAFHMPGHKRKAESSSPLLRELYARDLTEVPGTDDLQDPEPGGMICDAQLRAARLYGAEKTFFLLNGSTVGVLTAISAALPCEGTLLLQRSSHKSAYHAAELRGLRLSYLYGERTSDGMDRIVHLSEIRRKLEEDASIGAVFLTSPGYAGYCADIRAIAEYLHEKRIPLIVDAAHGAHLGMAEELPESAVTAGADITVMSLHKMLPAPTQTALLHLRRGARIDEEKVRHFLDIYQSTSPSYPLMAGIDDCIAQLEKWRADGNIKWTEWLERRKRLSLALAGLKHIKIADAFVKSEANAERTQSRVGTEQAGCERPEPGKLLICPKDGTSGCRLEERLRTVYHCQAEMALPQYVLCICTIADTEEDYDRLVHALLEIDQDESFWAQGETAAELPDITEVPEAVLTIAEAVESQQKDVKLADAAGEISGAYVGIYPPGQPMLVPGERITEAMAESLKRLYAASERLSGRLQGLGPEGMIRVVSEKVN